MSASNSLSPLLRAIVDCKFDPCLTQCLPMDIVYPVVLLLVNRQPA